MFKKGKNKKGNSSGCFDKIHCPDNESINGEQEQNLIFLRLNGREITSKEIQEEANLNSKNSFSEFDLEEIKKIEKTLTTPQQKQELNEKILGVLLWIEGAKEIIKHSEAEEENGKTEKKEILLSKITKTSKIPEDKKENLTSFSDEIDIDGKVKDFFFRKLQEGLSEEEKKFFILFYPEHLNQKQKEIEETEEILSPRPKYEPDIFFKTNINDIYISKKTSEVFAKGEKIKRECYYLEIIPDKTIDKLKVGIE